MRFRHFWLYSWQLLLAILYRVILLELLLLNTINIKKWHLHRLFKLTHAHIHQQL